MDDEYCRCWTVRVSPSKSKVELRYYSYSRFAGVASVLPKYVSRLLGSGVNNPIVWPFLAPEAFEACILDSQIWKYSRKKRTDTLPVSIFTACLVPQHLLDVLAYRVRDWQHTVRFCPFTCIIMPLFYICPMTSTDLITSREMVVSLANTPSSSRRMQIPIVLRSIMKPSKCIQFPENNDQNSCAQHAFFNVTGTVPRIDFRKNSMIFLRQETREALAL